MKWTEAQRETIETRNKNILVSAAAGSGKTAVLIERIKQLVIEEKTDIDRFLITTFTNAASAEMKGRLEDAIRAQLETDGADKQFLKRQLSLMPRANISTFHTFALEVMRRYFYLTDLEPGFKIGDEIEISIMKNEAVAQLFDSRFHEDYDAFKEFLKKYSSDRNENKIKANIISLYNEMRSIPHYMDWAEKTAELLDETQPSEKLGLRRFIAEEAAEELKASYELYAKAAEILETAGIEGLYEKALQDAELIMSALREAEAEESETGRLSVYGAFVNGVKFNQMRASKAQQEDYAHVKEHVTTLRKKGKKLLDDLAKKYFQRTMEEYDEELRVGYRDTLYMTGLIREFESIFRQKKSERNIVDFDDVMHYAIEILNDDMVSDEYKNRFEYIFIDEFQDSNMLQEAIIGRLAREDNLFMVGDVKQSIYKFRLAEPEIFKSKYAQYAKDDEANSVKIDLNNNFRSKRKVTDTVNRVFRAVMDDYDESAELKCTIPEEHPGYDTQLHIALSDSSDDGVLEDLRPEEDMVLRLINESLGKEIYDVKRGITRNAEYRDIVVLSRSKASIGKLERFLNNEGIPAYGENTGGYFETVEIQVFVNLLKVIDNTRQDIPLISVMRCPIFDFDVKELAAVRIQFRDGSFYDAVRLYRDEGGDDIIREKIDGMFEKLAYWKELKNTVTLEELIRILLYETGYFDYCSGLPVGGQRISNLRLLVEKAGQFEQNNHSGLYGFVSYIEAMKRSNLSVGEAKTLGENENVVRVMTVHKSKGLEFPIVILTGMGRTIKAKGIGAATAMHKDFTLAMPHVNHLEKWHRKTLLQRVIEAKKSKEEFEEEIRILYVAMTRAMDSLLLTGTVKDRDKLQDIIGKGKSFVEMVYPPMVDAGEIVAVHEENGMQGREAEGISARLKLAELFDRSRRERDEEKLRLIDERLSFRYPFTDSANVKSKYSVTELNKKENGQEVRLQDEVVFLRPEFSSQEKQLDAARMGTLMHLVMEKLNFKEAAVGGREHICRVIEQLCDDGLITEEERNAIECENIEAFFREEIGRRAAASERMYKEREFILQEEVNGTSAIVQGIIDCYFEDEDGLVLIDYKNSYIGRMDDERKIAERYKGQVKIYKKALELACGKTVKEAYLYLFNLKKFIPLEIQK